MKVILMQTVSAPPKMGVESANFKILVEVTNIAQTQNPFRGLGVKKTSKSISGKEFINLILKGK